MNFVMIEDGFLSLNECNTLIKKYKNKTNKKSLNQHVSYAECAYRNGMQDMYKYIEALVSE